MSVNAEIPTSAMAPFPVFSSPAPQRTDDVCTGNIDIPSREGEERKRGEREELGPLTVSVRECVGRGRSVGGNQEGRKEKCVSARAQGASVTWLTGLIRSMSDEPSNGFESQIIPQHD